MSVFQLFSNSFSRVTNRLSIGNKIILGYAIALSVAVLGTTAGLMIGNYYQNQASNRRAIADQQGELLSNLQMTMLETRPTKEFFSLLTDQIKFEQKKITVLRRSEKITALIDQLQASEVTQNQKELQDFLVKTEQLVVANFQSLAEVLQQVDEQFSQRENVASAKQLISDFALSSVFDRYLTTTYQLKDFIEIAQAEDEAAAIALAKAENLRTTIILISMLLSAAIALMLAVYTSRAIARPIQVVKNVAIAATQESNFDLQALVTTQDEIGDLAESLNLLIRKVKAQILELQQTQVQLIQTEKMASLGQVVGGMAHEINNPVNFIYGNLNYANNYVQQLLELVHLYQKFYPDSNPVIEHYIESIELDFLCEDYPKVLASMKMGVDRIHQVILSLRKFAYFDEAVFKEVNIHEGIDSCLVILQHRTKQKILVIKDYDNLPAIECYPAQLNQVFFNLINNAIDALEESLMTGNFTLDVDGFDAAQTKGNLTEIPHLLIQTKKITEREIKVIIGDNGLGILPETQKKLFDPFFTTKQPGKGMGLGLAIAYQTILKHHGTIEVVSEPKKSTQFVITLPIKLNHSSAKNCSFY